MRLKGIRFFSIKYNEGAREHLSGNGTIEDGILLSPLSFDAEVSCLCTRLGAPLTLVVVGDSPNCQLLWPCGRNQNLCAGFVPRVALSFRFSDLCSDTTVHPLHTAPRSPGMDTSVWEVNFNHRDDALNALMVSWFHELHLALHALSFPDFKDCSSPYGHLGAPKRPPRARKARPIHADYACRWRKKRRSPWHGTSTRAIGRSPLQTFLETR